MYTHVNHSANKTTMYTTCMVTIETNKKEMFYAVSQKIL